MSSLEELRPVWAEIDLDSLAHNIKEVRRITNKEAIVTAVVKANAYGHGSIEAAEVFLENGADRLAVATLSEAVELRRAGIDTPILILGYTPASQHKIAVENDIIEAVYNLESAEKLSQVANSLNKKAKVHIKVDSGMGRIGFPPVDSSIDKIEKISKLPNLEIEGIFTHFAKADEVDKAYTGKQFKNYKWVIERLEDKNIQIPIKHVSNSAATIDLPEYNLNMVRGGIMIYGLYPSDEVDKEKVSLKPAMTLKAKISHLKEVPEGTGISYGQIFVTKRKSKIATIPIGYADGFTRLLTSKAEVAIKGKRAPIVGKICMDQCMIDVTDIEDVKVGDEVVLFGDGSNGVPHIDEVAEKLGTINYEIVCMVGRRVPRVYIKDGKIIKIIDYLLD
ncbi:alanine racemase [Anaerosalibacter bizertensis]|uniref:Alanine racemase n=1 Tax=Anaerosalibacter bizertensis TaxID=932217 RepID=A0A9Q4AB19_9FIRM|nr:alanine racemase [Anaerosalibacter bizertensis]MBV1817554.1 alanine racemase [Bacteroidales bacterium MSK.15.36]MCB5558750.1 alanine racemase [Anaerosalibacter bizertensis]MCG4564092.1 alanine racemase [Anaerosalibacter bizertensis]MCG4582335.1 alanine racemase [Anaerosalibacter bizertensis]MCG4583950.1 alanine racemase [Anaerosalibacter bizertensis]